MTNRRRLYLEFWLEAQCVDAWPLVPILAPMLAVMIVINWALDT